MRTLVEGEVACGDVAGKYSHTLYVVGNRLLFIIGSLGGTDVGQCAVNRPLEGVAVNRPSGVLATLAAVETLHELPLLTAIDDQGVLQLVSQPCLVALAMARHVLGVGNII